MMETNNLKQEMLSLCYSAGFEPTENIDKIVKAKERFGIGLRCPCDRNNPERYCISRQCILDILEKGKCHCGCYKLPTRMKEEIK